MIFGGAALLGWFQTSAGFLLFFCGGGLAMWSIDHGKRPQTHAFLPRDYDELVERARDVDSRLHALLISLNEPNGPMSQLQRALSDLAHEYDDMYDEWKWPKNATEKERVLREVAARAVGNITELHDYIRRLAGAARDRQPVSS
jgi:hypothetical protein